MDECGVDWGERNLYAKFWRNAKRRFGFWDLQRPGAQRGPGHRLGFLQAISSHVGHLSIFCGPDEPERLDCGPGLLTCVTG